MPPLSALLAFNWRFSLRLTAVAFFLLLVVQSVVAQSPETRERRRSGRSDAVESQKKGVSAEQPAEPEKTNTGKPAQPVADERAADEPAAESKLPAATLALVGADIHTLSPAGVLASGVILIGDGKIVAVGNSDLMIPEGIERIDVAGQTLTPGLIDARSELWLTSDAANATASDASLNILDGVDGFSDVWNEVVTHGITSVYVQPSRQGALGGYGAVLSVVPGETGPVIHSEYAALQASLGIGASNNRSRSQQYERTKKAFDAAADYQKKWDDYNAYLKKKEESKSKDSDDSEDAKSKSGTDKKAADGEATATSPASRSGASGSGRGVPPGRGSSGRPGATRPSRTEPEKQDPDLKTSDSSTAKDDDAANKEKAPKKPDVDPVKEKLSKVLKGDIPLRLEIHSADDAYFAMKLVHEFKDLQVVLEGLSNLGSSTDAVAQLGCPVIMGPWLESETLFNSDVDSVAKWVESFGDYDGVLAIGSFGSAQSSRLLRAHLGKAIAAGLPPERALRAATIDAARLLGISDTVGSVEVGKRADLVCFNGDPTAASSAVTLVMSAGKVVYRKNESAHVAAMESSEDFEATSLPSSFILRSTRCLLPDGSIQAKAIRIENGVIASIQDLSVDSEVELRVIDVADRLITPGLFSAHATLGLNRSIDPDAQVDAAFIRATDGMASGFRGESQLISQGLLRALLAPGDSNPVAGTVGMVRLGAQRVVLNDAVATKFVLRSTARSADRFPSSLAGQLQLVNQSIAGELIDTRVFLPDAINKRIAAERTTIFESIASGERTVMIAAESDAEISAALNLIERHKMKGMLVGPRQLEPFIDRIKSLGVSIAARAVRPDDYDWYAKDIALASQSGIPIWFAGENAEEIRLTAALAVEAGMNPGVALASICNGPAELFDAPELAAGAPADLVIWSHSPVNLGGKPLVVLVDGQVISDEAK